MTHIVETTESSEQEFHDQYQYIAKRSPQGADSWATAFRRTLKKLENNPASRPLAPESEHHVEDIHQLLFKTQRGHTYRALFIIRGAGQDIMDPDEVQLPESD